jgi:hypothetical protein
LGTPSKNQKGQELKKAPGRPAEARVAGDDQESLAAPTSLQSLFGGL